MDSRQFTAVLATILLATVALPALSTAAEPAEADRDRDRDHRRTRDLVITEDSQIALLGRTGKAVIGSCKYEDPLWKGKIAIKNIGADTIVVPNRQERLIPPGTAAEEELPPHIRVYVPNNIELMAEARLTHDLKEFGQELIEIEVGANKNKCRNYDAPPVFDERLSGMQGPIRVEPDPDPGYGGKIRKIQRILIERGYNIPSPDGDFGSLTVKAVVAFFKDHNLTPPHELFQKPVPMEVLNLVLDTLAPGGPPPAPAPAETATIQSDSGDECKRGVNLVPLYIELDPDRKIPDENRTNNRLQFTVAIDCSNVAH